MNKIHILLCTFLTAKNCAAAVNIEAQFYNTAYTTLPWVPTPVISLIVEYTLVEKWKYKETLEEDSSRHQIQKRHHELQPLKMPLVAQVEDNRIILATTQPHHEEYLTVYNRKTSSDEYITGLIFSPNLQLLAWHKEYKSSIAHTKVWNIEKNKEMITIPESGYPSFFPNSTSILVVNKKNASADIWDLTTCKRTEQLINHNIKSIEWARVKTSDSIIIIAVEKGLWPFSQAGRALHLWRKVAST